MILVETRVSSTTVGLASGRKSDATWSWSATVQPSSSGATGSNWLLQTSCNSCCVSTVVTLASAANVLVETGRKYNCYLVFTWLVYENHGNYQQRRHGPNSKYLPSKIMFQNEETLTCCSAKILLCLGKKESAIWIIFFLDFASQQLMQLLCVLLRRAKLSF